MPYLGEYLGHLMAELAIARMEADLETVRLAELYAAHPLLRSMPVPHLRLPDVDVDLPVLIDHMGRPNPAAGRDDPSLKKVIGLLKRGNFWVMLSLAEKISKAGPPWDDVIPIMRALIEAAPERVIWASDWPHPVSTSQPPNEAGLVELLYRATSEGERKRILVDNPARLFGFT